MTRAKRDRQKSNRAVRNRHTAAGHQERPDPRHPGHFLPVNCPVCRPAPRPPDVVPVLGDMMPAGLRDLLTGLAGKAT